MSTPETAVEKILSNTFTQSDAFKRLSILQDALEHAFFTNSGKNVADALRDRIASPEDRAAAEAVSQWGDSVMGLFSSADVGKQLDELKKRIGALPTLTLYVASTLLPHDIAEIGAWCRQQVDPTVLIDLRYDRSAAGGCMIVWHNTMHDFTLQYFLRKHEKELSALLHEHNKNVVMSA